MSSSKASNQTRAELRAVSRGGRSREGEASSRAVCMCGAGQRQPVGRVAVTFVFSE